MRNDVKINNYDHQGEYLLLCAKKSGIAESPIIFDVGCNIDREGRLLDFTRACLTVFSDGENGGRHIPVDVLKSSTCHVYGVEPMHWYQYEQVYGSFNNVSLLKFALLDKEATSKFYSPSATGLSSIYDRACWQNWPEGDLPSEQVVECKRLDDITKELNIEMIDYLKLDCEGAELRILKGSEELLAAGRIKYIQFENQTGFKVDNGTSHIDVELYLASFGYGFLTEASDNFLWSGPQILGGKQILQVMR